METNELRSLIKLGESATLEFKERLEDSAGEHVARVVCSFLNGKGGKILVGVNDEGNVLGTHVDIALLDRLQLSIENFITPRPPLLSVNIDEFESRSMLTIEVPQGPDKPYVCRGGVFVRRGSITTPADSETIRAMVQYSSADVTAWERRVSIELEEEDLDADEIAQTAVDAKDNGRPKLAEASDSLEVLRLCSVFRQGNLTNAADVLFARSPGFRHPQARVRVVAFENEKTDDSFKDRLLEGPLYKVYLQAVAFVTEYVKDIVEFDPRTGHRQAVPTYPMYAVREGLVNAFVHRDYASASGGIQISVYPRKLVIWNSGSLPKGLKVGDLKKEHQSIPQNPDIAHVLFLRGKMERVGRGTQKILAACRNAGLPVPKWKDGPIGVTLELRLPDAPYAFKMNDRQRALVNSMSPGDTITLAEYSELFAMDLSERQARRDLRALVDHTFLSRHGAGPGTKYRMTGEPL